MKLFLRDVYTISENVAIEVRDIPDKLNGTDYIDFCKKIISKLDESNLRYKNIPELTGYANNYKYLKLNQPFNSE